MKINPATACFPGYNLKKSLESINNTIHKWPEKFSGEIVFEQCQICPQTPDTWNLNSLYDAVSIYPNTQFQFHANVRKESLLTVIDASVSRHSKIFDEYVQWFKEANKIIDAKTYSWHAGRATCSLLEAIDNTKALSDSLGIMVAIEGLYPEKYNKWLLSSWEDYAQLLSSKNHYAIDFSHLNIVAMQSGRYEKTLIKELVSSEFCIEIHLSDNNGDNDKHQPLLKEKWWEDCLKSVNNKAILFTESDLRFVLA